MHRTTTAQFCRTASMFLLALGVATQSVTGREPSSSIRFNRDVRPILSTHCWACHGPDSVARKGDLRLDQADAAYADRGGYRVIDGRRPEDSELLKRIRSTDPDEQMPPPEVARRLTLKEIETLTQWVRQGGRFEAHWSLIAPKVVEPPETARDGLRSGVSNPIDQFALARLKAEGLQPAARASKETLIRRGTLDLTGLPPTLEEVDAFLSDKRPDAWARVVDRLLASPRYGERMAQVWLDAARFADSGGYQGDILRDMSLWRDWVIRAYNENKPFDEFTIEQLAGDLLDQPTQDQLIATGFNRNHRINDEDGIILEEFRVEYVADRVETLATVWLGLTARCGRCHSHKFDALSQREYYGLFGFFNSIDEKGRGHGNSEPLLRIVPPALQARIDALDRQLADLRSAASPDNKPDEQTTKQIEDLTRQRDKLVASAPTTMVMRELAAPRSTHLLIRGAYDRPGGAVDIGTPSAIAPAFDGFPANRLGLAKWLVDPRNPLTARVTVNRYWQMLFGRGLVETSEDFGTQGQLPSHPELLDWLATEFVRSGWDVKSLLRLIVSSSTYCQTSQVSASAWQADPDNRLLSRGPRFRLSAEALRDQALFASGLLNEQLGGRSVRPYQPEGLWDELASASRKYEQSIGGDLYRRSLYTFIRRTVPPPSMTTLDATDRELCTVRRQSTNTPLQALVLMNDDTWVEAARALAERCLTEGPRIARFPGGEAVNANSQSLTRAFRVLLARSPTPQELSLLTETLSHYRHRFVTAPDDARKLISTGESKPDETLNIVDLAAYTAVCSLLINLDEAITRE